MSDARIHGLFAYEALDSRGRPTVACVVRLHDGSEGHALAPSGASTGRHEAVELRDGGERFGGRGVQRAVASVNGELRAAVAGADATDQADVDARLRRADGTDSLKRLGGNAVLAVSLATAQAAARSRAVPLWRLVSGDRTPLIPMPMVNIVSGGAHAGGLVDVQDYLVIPVGATSFAESMEWVWRVRSAAAGLLRERGGNADLVADEGGLAHRFDDNTAPLDLLVDAIAGAGLRPGDDVAIALDVAATQLVAGPGEYMLAREQRRLSSEQMVSLVSGWAQRYPLVSVEDPLGEDDWEGFRSAVVALPGIQVIGDDLFTTRLDRVQRGLRENAATSVLAKINQNGTVSGTAEVLRAAQAGGMTVVVSARSGETEDDSIADLAIGWRAGQLKVGSLTRSERTAKWNRVLRIEAELGDAEFAGGATLQPPTGS